MTSRSTRLARCLAPWLAGLAACQSAPPAPPAQHPAPQASTRALPAVEARALGIGEGDPNQASGAGTLLIYSSSTGHIPFKEITRTGVVYRAQSEQDREAARAAGIEAEIAEAVREAEGLEVAYSDEIDPTRVPAAPDGLGADPREAPRAPALVTPPGARSAEQTLGVPAGSWGNARPLQVVRHELDVDGDADAEQTRYFDAGSGRLLRLEEDRDGDGRVDAWSSYDPGGLAERSLDASGDGKPDAWEQYARGRMTARRIDRDGDGDVEVAYYYEGDSLVEERHDADGDGAMDLVVHYEGRVRVRAEEDRDRDGQTDTWTTYQLVDGDERVAKIERDRDGDGTIDQTSSYGGDGGPAAPPVDEEISPL